jgi:hypothetical protein
MTYEQYKLLRKIYQGRGKLAPANVGSRDRCEVLSQDMKSSNGF